MGRLSEMVRDRINPTNLYTAAFVLFFIWSWVSHTSLVSFLGAQAAGLAEIVLQVVILTSLLLVFFSVEWSLKRFVVASCLALLGFITWRTSGEAWLFWLSLFSVNVGAADMKKVAKSALFLGTVFLLAIPILAAVGVIDSTIEVRSGFVRYSLGFNHPNLLGALIITVCMAFVVLNYEESSLKSICLCVLGGIVCLVVPGSRTSCACLFLMASVLPLFKWARRKGHETTLIWTVMTVITALIIASIWFMYNYNPEIQVHAWLDKLLSGRLSLSHVYLADHAPSLFGYDYADGTKYYAQDMVRTFVVDNLYCHVLLREGVLSFLVLVIGILGLFKKALSERYAGPLLFCTAVFLVFGFSETLGCRVEFNFCMPFLALPVFGGHLKFGKTAEEKDFK